MYFWVNYPFELGMIWVCEHLTTFILRWPIPLMRNTYRNRPLSTSFREYFGILPLPSSPSKSLVSMPPINSIDGEEKNYNNLTRTNELTTNPKYEIQICTKSTKQNPDLSGILFSKPQCLLQLLQRKWSLKCWLGSLTFVASKVTDFVPLN